MSNAIKSTHKYHNFQEEIAVITRVVRVQVTAEPFQHQVARVLQWRLPQAGKAAAAVEAAGRRTSESRPGRRLTATPVRPGARVLARCRT